MIRRLVDTSAYSAHLRDLRAIARAIAEADELYVSVVVLGELRAGHLRGSKGRRNEELLAMFLASPRVRVLDVDEETSHRYAIIHADLRSRGTPVSPNDEWIAATAVQHGLRVLTTDSDFKKIPQAIVDFVEPHAA